MSSPLEDDAKIVKEFSIKAEHEMDDVWKVSYVRSQLEEIKKFLWRERTELLMAEGQAKNSVEELAAKARTDVATHRSTIKGVLLSIGVLNDLLKELEAKLSD